MDSFHTSRIKWPYVTHLVDRARVAGLLPTLEETNPGSLVLARVVSLSKHKDLEAHDGRKMTLYAGDVIVGALGNRYATDQFEGVAHCSGQSGHILGIGGVCGQVVSMNNRMIEPTVIEYLGRLAGPDAQPLHLSDFRMPVGTSPSGSRPTTILSLGASMNAGKTTTAAQLIFSLSQAGHRVAAAKITGTACRKDPNILYDAGAVSVLDFTHAGWPSTAGCSKDELLAIASHLRSALASESPEFVVIEIADGIIQRESAMLLSDEGFHDSIDAVTFAGPDALSVESGARRLEALGYELLATAGPVANGRLGIQEAESACGVSCLDGASIMAGALLPRLVELRGSRQPRRAGRGGGASGRVAARAVGPTPTGRPSSGIGTSARATPIQVR